MTDMPETSSRADLWHFAWRFLGGLLLALFGTGMIMGIALAAVEKGRMALAGWVALGVAVLLLAGGLWLLRSTWPHLELPRSPRVRRSRVALYVAMGVSLFVGLAAGITGQLSGDVDNLGLMFTSAPISVALALCALVGWFVAIAVSAYWHTTLDEIERAEYEFGGSLGMYAYVLVAPAWWIAWRGGLLPEPDGVAIFWMVMIVWCIGWAWRRYR